MSSPTGPACCPTPTLLERDQTVAMAQVFAALGDPTRLQLTVFVGQCSPAPVCACSFPEVFDMSRSTISHHLTKLVEAGILERSKEGKWSYYTVNPSFDQEILQVVSNQTHVSNHCAKKEPGEPVTILFACTQNAGRSQIAAAIAASLGGPDVHVLSAGTNPASEVHPIVATVLSEIGLNPLSGPKKLDPADVKEADWVITMGCGETCPIFPGTHYEDWEITDPSGKPLPEVREIRDTIRAKVENLLTRTTSDSTGQRPAQ